MTSINVYRSLDPDGFLHFSTNSKDIQTKNKTLESVPSPSMMERKALSSVQVNQGLYEEVLLTSSAQMTKGGKDSNILSFLHQLFKSTPDIPPQFLAELQLAAKWAEKLETITMTSLSPEQYKNRFAELTLEVSNLIKGLEKGKGCLIPGGAHVIFRILKTEDYEYSLMPFSRAANLNEFEHINPLGREKTRRITLEKLHLDDISDTEFIAKLLLISQKGKHSITDVNSIVDGFKNNIIKNEKSRFHLSKTSLCRIQNIWDLLHEGYNVEQTGQQISRQKLELQLIVFLEYFEQVKGSLSKDLIAFKYLQDGLKILSRNSLLAYSKGHLHVSELKWIYDHLNKSEKELVRIKQPNSTKLQNLFPPSSCRLQITATPIHLPKIDVAKEVEQNKNFNSTPPVSTPYLFLDKRYELNIDSKSDVTASSCLEQLDNLASYLKKTNLLPLQREQTAVDFCLGLPLSPASENNLWKMVSASDRTTISLKLAEISANLTTLMNLTGSNAPNRILALAKIAVITEYLARLNYEQTKFEQHMFLTDLFFLIADLLRGSGGYSEGIRSERSLLGHSVYPVHSVAEETVLSELKAYYVWLSTCQSCLSKRLLDYIHDLSLENELSERRYDETKRGISDWSSIVDGKQISRKDIEIDLSKKPYKDNPQCQQLQNMLQRLRLEIKAGNQAPLGMIQSYMRGGMPLSNPMLLAEACNRWGRSIKNPLLLAIFYAFRPEKGKLDPFSFDSNTFTQEAIMDDPWLAFERAFIHWQTDLSSGHPLKKKSYSQVAYTAKPELLSCFSENDLRDLLLALEPMTGLWNILGLIKKNPVLLKNTDFQSIAERMILQPEMIKRSLTIDPKLPEFLGPFFKAHIQQLERIKEIPAVLFMVHLFNTIARKIPKESLPAEFPTFMPSIRRWCYDSLKPNSEWLAHRYGLLSELLVQMGAQKNLSHPDMKDFVIFYCLWENTPAQNDFDPVQADLIRKQYFQWMPLIKQAFNDSPQQNLLRHILEEVAGTKGIALDKNIPWEGEFPIYSTKEWKIDLATGIFTNLQKQTAVSSLPPEILNDPLFQEAFPNFLKHSFSCFSTHHEGIAYHHFKDAHGIVNLIERTTEGLCIYKSNPLDPKKWTQYVSLEKRSIHELGALGLNNRLYVSLSNPIEALLFHIEGNPEFKLILQQQIIGTSSEIMINSILNISSNRQQPKERQAVLMDVKLHERLKPLLNLANPSEILIWTQNNKLQSIEFYGLELTFDFVEGDFICKTKPFLEYKLDLNAAPPYELPAGLLLLPPENSQDSPQWILPHFSGKYDIQQPDTSSSLVNQATSYLWNAGWSYMGYKIKESESASVDRLYWKFDTSASKGFWSFSLRDNLIISPDPSQDYKSYFDLFRYALCASQANVPQAIAGAKECLRKIREIPFNKVPEKEMEAFAKDVAHMACARSKITSKPQPETIALAMHCFLAIKDKGSTALSSKIEEHLSKLTPFYFSRGRQVHLKALLDVKQELACLMLMKTYQLEWFQEHAPLLSHKEEQIKSIARKNKDAPIFSPHSQPPLPLKYFKSSETPNHFIKSKIAVDLTCFKTPEAMAEDFISIYQVACDPKTPIFKKIHRLIKKLAEQTHEQKDSMDEIVRLTGGNIEKSKGSIRISYKENHQDKLLLFKYLEAVFNIKSRHPDLDLPRLKMTIDAFCSDLTLFVKNNFHLVKVNPAASVEEKVQKNRVKLILEDLFKNPLLPLDAISIESGLEKKLLDVPCNPLKKIPVICFQKGDALFSPDYLRPFFNTFSTCPSFDLLTLNKLENSNEPSVRKAAEALQNEIDDIKDNGPITQYQCKELAYICLRYQLNTIQAPLISQQQTLKQSLEKMLKIPRTLVFELQVLAGYDQPVSFDELIIAFLQQDLDALAKRLPPHVDLQKITDELTAYLKIDVKIKSINRALNELSELQQDPYLLNAGSKIYELLSRKRCFDPAKNPELLAMESLFGFMIREDQLKMVIDFIEKPCCIRQASTGAGKTNVILPLVALMKADGYHLVSLKFLDPLFNESFERLQKLLGSSFQKKIFPLLFSGETRSTCDKIINGKRVKQSIFKHFYEESIKTILNKGFLITNKKSQPLLKAKMIEIYERLSQILPHERPEMDLEHLQYLGKLLCLFKEREETLYDEFDKFLSPREELHLRIGQGKPLAPFVSETTLNLYDLLINNKTLNLKENTQAEIPKKIQSEILDQTIEALSALWQKKDKGLSVKDYLKGTLSVSEEALFLKTIERKLSLQELDILSLQKDLLSEFIKTTLFKSADQRYIRSKIDEKSVIPCDYADMPKEGSEFEDIRVKLCYLIQYYYQKGPSYAFFNQWIQGLKSQAIESLIAGQAPHITMTASEKMFKDYFPQATLDGITQETIKSLYKALKRDSSLIRKFLKVLTQEQKLPGKKISLNPHNQVSIAKASAGTSATKGCLEGLHRRFIIDDKSSNSNAKMIARLLQRIDPKEPFLTFEQKNPKEIISELLKQDKKIKVIIDGAGALRGMSFDKPAKQLLEHQSELEAAGYFDQKGRKHLIGTLYASDNESGLVYSNAQARGADARLSVHHKAVLLVNGRSSQEEVSQNEGRLRNEDQKLQIAVPKGSEIKDAGDLINVTLATESQEKSLDLFLSKQQEMQDIVHDQMTSKLAEHAAEADFTQGFEAYTTFAPYQILVSEFPENWDIPGSYYRLHKHIKRTKDSVNALESIKEKFLTIARQCHLTLCEEELLKVDLEKFRSQLPLEVSGDMKANQEVQIETETQTEVQTEVETDIDIDTETEKPSLAFYLPWGFHKDYKTQRFKEFHPAYDEMLGYSSNFLPLNRNYVAPSGHQRAPHDPRQNRLVHVDLGWLAIAQDVKDISERCFDFLKNKTHVMDWNLYDTRLNRYIHEGDAEAIKNLEEKNSFFNISGLYWETKMHMKYGKKIVLIAQLRFEDGQFNGYTDEEWTALKGWIQNQKDPKDLEDYFVNEVLKHRPQDRERYLFSPLQELFQQVTRSDVLNGLKAY